MEERVEQRGVEFRVVMEYVLVCKARYKLMRGGLVKIVLLLHVHCCRSFGAQLIVVPA